MATKKGTAGRSARPTTKAKAKAKKPGAGSAMARLRSRAVSAAARLAKEAAALGVAATADAKTRSDARAATKPVPLVPPGWPDTSEGYTPSEHGKLAARLVDGEARVVWEAVPHDDPENRARGVWVDDDELALGKALITTIVEAFAGGHREVLGRLGRAYDIVIDRPRTESEKLVHYVDKIQKLAGWLRESEAGRFMEPETLCFVACNGLAEWNDPAFVALTPKRLREALKSFEHDETKRKKGGPKVRGAARIAAELAVEVGAFGASHAPGEYDAAVDQMTRRLQIERARKSKPSPSR